MKTCIKLQHVPPSVNEMYTNVARKGRVKTDRYRTWLQAAGWDMNTHSSQPKWREPVYVTIILGKLRANSDVDNRCKPILDILKTYGFIPDDNCQWVKGVNIWLSSVPFEGVEIRITAADREAA